MTATLDNPSDHQNAADAAFYAHCGRVLAGAPRSQVA